MGRYRKNTFNRWYSRTSDRPPASIYPLSRFDRPKITKINYIRSHPSRPLLPWEPLLENGARSVDIVELAGLIERAASLVRGLEWQKLLKPRPFPAVEPTMPLMPAQPEALELPAIRAPKLKPLPPPLVKGAVRLRPTFWQRLLPARFEKAVRTAEANAEQYYQSDYAAWEEQVTSIKRKNEAALRAYEEAKEKQLLSPEALYHSNAMKYWLEQAQLLEQEFAAAHASWSAAKEKFDQQASAERELVASLHQRYLAGECEAIILVTTLVLRISTYPQAFPRSIEVQYKPENRIAIVNLQLPDFQAIEIVQAKKKIGQKERTQLVEETLYAIAIRTLYEVVSSDQVRAFDSVVFNGWVHFIDGASGHPRDAVILSVHATRDQIAGLNIAQVDPLECFRALKGVAAKRISAYPSSSDPCFEQRGRPAGRWERSPARPLGG